MTSPDGDGTSGGDASGGDGAADPRPDARIEAFEALAEIAIVHQLASAEMARHLPDGLHPSHFAVLRHLTRRGDGRSLLSIARAMQTTKPNMTNTVAKLTERGLAEVRDNPDDRRSKLLFLTNDGRAFVARAAGTLAPVLKDLDDRHGLARVAAMLPELRALRETLDAMRD